MIFLQKSCYLQCVSCNLFGSSSSIIAYSVFLLLVTQLLLWHVSFNIGTNCCCASSTKNYVFLVKVLLFVFIPASRLIFAHKLESLCFCSLIRNKPVGLIPGILSTHRLSCYRNQPAAWIETGTNAVCINVRG